MLIELVLFFAILLLFVWVLAGHIFDEIQRLHRIQVWPAVMGRIADVEPTGFDSEEKKYDIHVMYQYHLLGAMYSGSADIRGESGEPAAELSRSYHIGKDLLIVYNPDQPAQSIIADARHNDISIGTIVSWIIASSIVACMIWFAASASIRWIFR